MRLIYHPEAEAELIGAAEYYERRLPGLGAQLLDAVDAFGDRAHAQSLAESQQGGDQFTALRVVVDFLDESQVDLERGQRQLLQQGE